jgi:hypothetical protein
MTTQMNRCIFWDITPCSPLKVNRRSGGTCCPHLQGWGVNQARNLHEAVSKQSFIWFILKAWRWKRNISPKRRFAFSGLRCVIFQKAELCITTAVKTSNPTAQMLFYHMQVRHVESLGKDVGNVCNKGTRVTKQTTNKLRGFSPPANYTDRATAACRRS